MYYYRYKGANLVSLTPLDGFGPPIAPVTAGRLYAPVPGDAVLGRGSFASATRGSCWPPTGWRCWTPPA